MSLDQVGQRCTSEREPELGLGLVEQIDDRRIGIRFPAAGESRLYARGTTVLKRVQFRPGETIHGRHGESLTIEEIDEESGLLRYHGQGRHLREDAISDVTSVSLPQERFLSGQVDAAPVFALRQRALELRAHLRQSPVRGYLGGRVQLIPHQFYILQEVAQRQIPRVLLADEVGLGKTIESCLIVQRLLAVGRARRVLILVPEPLLHQWFVELLRRFNLWFSLYDEERCQALEASQPNLNPFLASQLALASLSFLTKHPERREQAVAAGWDVLVVDEAHHLHWSPDEAGDDYLLVEHLAANTPGLLLLTATPMQLGPSGHFARLRLLDPSRFSNYEAYQQESREYPAVAAVAAALLEQRPLTEQDEGILRRLFTRDPDRITSHLQNLQKDPPRAREELLRALIDQHGTGRVVFRNTRAAMTGFPERQYHPIRLPANATQRTRLARELEAEEKGETQSIRYSFREDPRVAWLAEFLRADRQRKVLLICRSERKVAAVAAALQQEINAKVALFHEGLPLVQRDRNAAWFAEPDGAQLLLCSEIGSEGRNFQFAHDLVLLDLPLNPGLLEQRIGRLDRIGQSETIHLHVPLLEGSSLEAIAAWYDRGLDAFRRSVQGADEYMEAFRDRLLEVALEFGEREAAPDVAPLEALIKSTSRMRAEVEERLQRGRDRLLELNSHRPEVAAVVLERIRQADADPVLRRLLFDLLDHFGVRIREHEGGDVFLDPTHAFLHPFPSIPADGMLASFDRSRAMAREDIRFLSADHPLVHDSLDLLLNGPTGTAGFGFIRAPKPNLLLEAVFVLEAVADARWHVDEYLAPWPVRVLVDIRGQDLTDERDATSIAAEVESADVHRFLERPGFNAEILKSLLEGAAAQARRRADSLRNDARAKAEAGLSADVQRLRDLARVNPQVSAEEVDLARERLENTLQAIAAARLRLDALRLLLEGPPEMMP